MSTEQPTLADSVPAPHERALKGEGARYGRTDATHDPAPADADCCLSCGREIEAVARERDMTPVAASEVQRVFGDEHGRVPACPHPECAAGRGFSQAVSRAQASTQVKIMTPQQRWSQHE